MDKVIAVFDVLGFKNRLTRDGLPALSDAYDALRKVVTRQRASMMLNCAVPVKGGRAAAFGLLDVNHDYFSDTIVLWCSYSSFHFPPFCGLLLEFFCDVLELRIPLRGGIAVGEARMDKSKRTYLGIPLNEAAEVENAQKWIGVSFGPSFACSPYNSLFEPEQVLVFRRHRKSGSENLVPGLVLDWPRRWRDTKQMPPQQQIAQLNVDPNPKFADYYANTIDFVNFSEQNKDWHRGGSIYVKD
jgi:hypothetical protein